jgi:demethylmenaquinone methyltransferase/2-methoxy-6-polyprenyl-1,4-benzoquinol methylase
LRPDGRVFLIDSGPPENADDGELQVRQLADGREFTIVKRFWQPDELAERVAELGFQLDLALTENGLFLYGGSA